MSPDGRRRRSTATRNFWIANADGSDEVQVTTDGSVPGRIKNGTRQLGLRRRAGPDDGDVVVARQPQGRLLPLRREPGPRLLPRDEPDRRAERWTSKPIRRPGAPNPIAEVFVYDVGDRRPTKIDVRDGKPFDNDVVGHYVYNIRWSPDGTELLMNRTNRRQQIMEFVACSPATAKCRVVVNEEWPTGWTDNRPGDRWLQGPASGSSGNRSATAGRTTTCTTSPAS